MCRRGESLASLRPQVFQLEGLRRLKGKYGVALLNDVEVVVVVAERAMETVVVHFGQDELKEEQTGVGGCTLALAFPRPHPFTLINIY